MSFGIVAVKDPGAPTTLDRRRDNPVAVQAELHGLKLIHLPGQRDALALDGSDRSARCIGYAETDACRQLKFDKPIVLVRDWQV